VTGAPTVPTATETAAAPETAALLLATFADLYRQEIGAEEDVHRSLPFFGTALGIVIGALAYAAGRLPKWPDLTTKLGVGLFLASAGLLAFAVFEAACVLCFISRATARRDYKRIGPETALLSRLRDLQAFYAGQEGATDAQDRKLLPDMRQVLLDSYSAVTPVNRGINQRRYLFRAKAAAHLVRSLIWALGATTVIFVADKLGDLPKVMP
jgi:hypothetical protein